MTISEDILQFHFSSSNFKQSAQKIIPVALSSLNDVRIDKLNKISDEIGVKSLLFSGDNLIPIVFRKFKNSIDFETVYFERRELRTLSYSLTYSESHLNSIFNSEDELKIALTKMEGNWRDSYLFGLIDCLLRNWETNYIKSLEYLEKFISEKLANYSGNRSTLNSFKNNKRYFNLKNGDLILGDTIAKLNKPIEEATKMLGVPESWFVYSYFSKVIITYYEKNKANIINVIDNLNDVIIKHNSSITSKRLVSKMIIQGNQSPYTFLQDKLKKIAFNQIGDPSNISNWLTFENASDTEKSELIQAREILNVWITQQFINVFFNVCINDERRKKFWLRFASKISSFKVYGPQHTKALLKRDERIAEYVDARFETFISKRDVSAFILYLGNHMFITFSNDGYASIAYKQDSLWKPNLNHKMNSADNLRNSSMPMAIDSDYYKEEGRLFQKDGKEIWETRFNNWIKQKVLK